MDTNKRTCAICFVHEKDAGSLATFPSDVNRCRQWLKVIGYQSLLNLSVDGLNKSYFVCGDHFDKEDYDQDGNLMETCIPSLKLRLPMLTDNEVNVFPVQTIKKSGFVKVIEGLVDIFKNTECTYMSLRKNVILIKTMNLPSLRESVSEAMKNHTPKPAPNWSRNNKIAAMTVYRQAPEEYKFLSSIVPLPGIDVLHDMLRKLRMETGIDYNVLYYLKLFALTKSLKNRMCVLSFDEMPLRPNFEYNELDDKVDGFEDLGPLGTTQKTANCAGVFMIQGLHEKFKQPLAYYFVKDTISPDKLAVIIKEVIKAVNNTGYKILAIVCDQKRANAHAIDILQRQSGTQLKNCFMVEKDKIYIVHDVPYLFIGLRNEFLEKGTMIMKGVTAKWKHFEEFLKHKNVIKAASAYVNPTDEEKFTVKYAAQLLSHTISGMLKEMCKNDKYDSNEYMGTALIVDELDQMFDYTNGSSNKEATKKDQRKPCSFKTKHIAMWRQYQKTLTTVEFLKDGVETPNACVGGYIMTLTSLEDIWRDLAKIGFKQLDLRTLNLDPLQNLFAFLCIYSGGTVPTCTQFMDALKVGLLCGFKPHNPDSHREPDSHHILVNFHQKVFANGSSATE